MEIYLALGSNVGDRQQIIISAIESLHNHSQFFDIRISSMYLTEPYGLSQQRGFVNCAVRLESILSPRELLTEIQRIENQFGRTREIKWGPRTLDIDILFYGNEIIQEPDLIIPHPEIHKRSFVLQPLCELCPDLIHPVLHRSVKKLLESILGNSSSPIR